MTPEKWHQFPKEKQILNVAAEFSRVKFWLTKNNEKEVLNCLERALELLDLTISDPKWRRALGELLRLREVVCEFYIAKEKDINQFLKIFKTLLLFNKFTASVKI